MLGICSMRFVDSPDPYRISHFRERKIKNHLMVQHVFKSSIALRRFRKSRHLVRLLGL
jgi:hypothetical protein